jgi:dethiobiotin synthetase
MILFVTGIDTGIGKTIATGLLAAAVQRRGVRVVTQKLVQTGCEATSEDIVTHRRLMNIATLPEDRAGLTCPALYPLAASPHLAADLAGKPLDIPHIVRCTRQLADLYELVLVEGAGGLMVPLTRALTILDLVAQQGWPVILVTAPRLGSINHTLLSLEALAHRNIPLAGIIYNLHHDAAAEIVSDSRRIISDAARKINRHAIVLDLPTTAAVPESWEGIDLTAWLNRG